MRRSSVPDAFCFAPTNCALVVAAENQVPGLEPSSVLLRKVRHRGVFKVGWVFTFAAAAYNLVRMRNLAMQAM